MAASTAGCVNRAAVKLQQCLALTCLFPEEQSPVVCTACAMFPDVNLNVKTVRCFSSKNRLIQEQQRAAIWDKSAMAKPHSSLENKGGEALL